MKKFQAPTRTVPAQQPKTNQKTTTTSTKDASKKRKLEWECLYGKKGP